MPKIFFLIPVKFEWGPSYIEAIAANIGLACLQLIAYGYFFGLGLKAAGIGG